MMLRGIGTNSSFNVRWQSPDLPAPTIVTADAKPWGGQDGSWRIGECGKVNLLYSVILHLRSLRMVVSLRVVNSRFQQEILRSLLSRIKANLPIASHLWLRLPLSLGMVSMS